jgi:hypothetical protein
VVLGFELRALHLLSVVVLNHTSSPFCSGYFGDKVIFFAQGSLDYDPPSLHFLLKLGWPPGVF